MAKIKRLSSWRTIHSLLLSSEYYWFYIWLKFRPNLWKKNCGSSKCSVYTSKQKWGHIEEFESWENDKITNGEDTTVTAYIKEYCLGTKFKKFLSTYHPGWREPSIRNSIKSAVIDKLKSKLAVPSRANLYIDKCPIMECKLVDELKNNMLRKQEYLYSG